MSVRQQLEILVKLQAIDADIQEIHRMLGSVKEKTDKLDSELEAQESILATDENTIDELKRTYRSLESNVNSNVPKIEKSKGRLSSVKTNKEYQSLLKEIEDLTLINSELEDQMLACLEQMEMVETRIKDNAKQVSAFKLQVDQDKDAIRQEAEKGREKLEKLEKEWQRVFDTVEPDFMTKFDRVRKQVGNYTIARVVKAVCEGCNTNIPPQMFNELQRCEELLFCPHCQRIIYTE
jgi:hypothetical protein